MSSLIFPLTYSKCDHMKVGIQPSFIFINMAAKRYKINTFDCLFAYIYNFSSFRYIYNHTSLPFIYNQMY